ncbi:MAG: asparagine synthase (glutamine-hydrolyzing) [Chitinophagaceae bacterium]
MCGIAGSVNLGLDFQKLKGDLWHRGPDERNTFSLPGLELYHFRLSIVDIACGKQPMSFHDLTIIFNGEIYNHLELRKRHGLSCDSGSDTETILRLYALMKEKCLNELDGMFVFAIYDHSVGELFIARDRAGEKPLYYYSAGNQFVFASELNAIRNQLDLTIREEAIHQYVRMGYFHKGNTPYMNVHELQAGSFARIRIKDASVETVKWWDIHSVYLRSSPDSFEEALEKTDAFLHTSVKRRVESSDLEVGSFLSGGIDSGIVTAVAKKYNPNLKTFTVSFEGEYDEAPLARLVSEKCQTSHHEIKISFDSLEKDIEQILVNYGEPFFDSSAIPSYYVSEAAKKHLTVILNGDGGDELFGGYRRYVPFAKFDFFNMGPLARGASSVMHSILPPPHNKKSGYNFLYRLIDLSRKQGLDTYLSATIDSFEGYESKLSGGPQLLETIENDFRKISLSGLPGLKKIMNLDFDNILAGDLLVKMDIATMAHSLEGRSPLLSKELLEYIPTLASDYLIRGRTTKYLLRTLAERYLPKVVIDQPKRGFEIPLKKWIDHELRSIIADYIFSPDAYCYTYVDRLFVEKLWKRQVSISDEKRAKMIWTLFVLEVWYNKCFLKNA